ncbi:YceI family protein [Daejeonella sp. H1SJ63]|uniref:YceI family protein n=1 Tax=Daejeonella sp. H1SJ63 TaxID=3034145 RepID=UPI0023ECA7A5|nr:YceI family protein [Daejeonella sp. H1SJ63]
MMKIVKGILFRLSFTAQMRVLMFICLMMPLTLVFGQQQHYVYQSGQVEVSGYTNNYNWKLKTDSIECKSNITLIKRQLKVINSLHFTVAVKNLSSPNTYMDRIAHKSLKVYPFDKIIFQHLKSEITPMEDNAQYQVKANGNLTIGGVTQLVKMDLVATLINDGTIVFTGSQNLKLSTYQVTPKRTLMGTLKTNDEVTVNFIIGLRPQAAVK